MSPSSTNSYVLIYLVCPGRRCSSARRFAQIAKDVYTVFDFWASWCGPCKVISPIFEKLSTQFPNVEFYKVNVDEAEEISQEVGVRAVRARFPQFPVPAYSFDILALQMPTFALFKNGQKVKEVVGANPPALQVRS